MLVLINPVVRSACCLFVLTAASLWFGAACLADDAPPAEPPAAEAAAPAEDDAATQRKIDVLRSIWQDVEANAAGSDERKKYLAEFMDKSELVRTLPADYPALGGLWTLRALAACELDRRRDAWEAGDTMIRMGLGRSSNELVRKTLALLERKGLLDPEAPEPKRFALQRTKIPELLATAKANDSEENGRIALGALDELLKLDPDNAEGAQLRRKIARYYIPSKVGDTATNSIGMKFAYIPERGFVMATTEVTQAQWQAVIGNNPSHFKGANLPVEQVSWDDAQAFCQKLSQKEGKKYRLPTEAEWEYACRAGTTTEYYTGDGEAALKRAGWYDGNSGDTTQPVGRKEANAWGLYDMHGNVWEWCEDSYDASKASRVLRGGSWYSNATICRSSNRGRDTPGYRDDHYGFRVVLDLSE